VKFYATRPSRQRLAEDVRAFVSLLKFQRDEQAQRMIVGDGPAAPALHAALAAAGLTARLEDPGVDGPWRDRLDDPLDPYAPEAARAVDFEPGKGKEPFGDALYRFSWAGEPTVVIGRFRAEPKGAGFTLRWAGFEKKPVPPPPAKAPKDEEPKGRTSILDDLARPAKPGRPKKSIL
jgi:hypothetical protein